MKPNETKGAGIMLTVDSLTQEQLEMIEERFDITFDIEAVQDGKLNIVSKTINYGEVNAGVNKSAFITDNETLDSFSVDVTGMNDDEEVFTLILTEIVTHLNELASYEVK